ncbi:MAG: hypothetical protein U0841_15080 [Chloroflexia bacterium]
MARAASRHWVVAPAVCQLLGVTLGLLPPPVTRTWPSGSSVAVW